jgi:hypothetical protein
MYRPLGTCRVTHPGARRVARERPTWAGACRRLDCGTSQHVAGPHPASSFKDSPKQFRMNRRIKHDFNAPKI